MNRWETPKNKTNSHRKWPLGPTREVIELDARRKLILFGMQKYIFDQNFQENSMKFLKSFIFNIFEKPTNCVGFLLYSDMVSDNLP